MKFFKTLIPCLVTLVLLAIGYSDVSAQKWKKTKPNTLFARNKGKAVTPILVGIGTKTPTALFHTVGTVRLQGLTNSESATRFVAMDVDGNLYWRDAAGSSGGTSWLLNGNNVVAANFLGTINNEELRIRTNNIQRAVFSSTGSFGIGITAPTAQLHTTGTVRFEGVVNNVAAQRIAFFDNNGNLFYRDLSSLPSNYWGLSGNGGTNPANNFLGTTDNNRLVFRTNNTEKMTILANGNVGIGLSNPTSPLHVFSTTDDNQLFLSGFAPSTRYFQGPDWFASPFHARIGMATGNANYVATSQPGDFIVQALDNGNLLFGTNGANANGLERMRISSIGYAGIATTNPTAKLHVNAVPVAGQTNPSNIRFENLPAGTGTPVVMDANGYIFSSSGTSNAWNVTGNGGTNPTNNFLGTTDNNRLVIRTNNTEKMTILANGKVGIGVTNPLVRLNVSDNPGTITGFPYEVSVFEKGGDMKFGIFCSNPAPLGLSGGGASVALGYSNFTNAGGLYPGYEMQFGALNSTSSFMRFNAIQRNSTGAITTALFHAMVLDNTGNVGINLGPVSGLPNLPTAKFHTNGTVRHEGLATGTGNILVVDVNGNVFKSTAVAISAVERADAKELKNELQKLKQEIETLRSIVNSMKAGSLDIDINNDAPALYQNSPNPFSRTTTIRYYLPSGFQKASLEISNLQGSLVKNYQLSGEGKQSATVNANELPAGTYIYTLIVNERRVDSKKMILTQ